MNDEAETYDEPEVVEAEAVEESEPVVEQAPVREWSDEDADEAKAFGWKSPDEWQGDVPAGYIDDPRRYLERAENFRPFKALKQRMETSERDAAERLRKLEAMSDRALETQREQHKREMAEIAQRQRAAVENADVDAWDDLERRKQAMQAPAEPQPVQRGPDPYVAEYEKANEWVRNPVLRKAGADIIEAAGLTNMPAQKQIEYAEAEVRKLYPGYFPAVETPQPKPIPQQRVDAGGLAGGAMKGGAFAKLPAEAKAAFKKFAGEGLFKDNEEDRKRYADDYNAA